MRPAQISTVETPMRIDPKRSSPSKQRLRHLVAALLPHAAQLRERAALQQLLERGLRRHDGALERRRTVHQRLVAHVGDRRVGDVLGKTDRREQDGAQAGVGLQVGRPPTRDCGRA